MISRRETARLLCCLRPLQSCRLRLGVVVWTLCDLLWGIAALVQTTSLLPSPFQRSDFELGLLISALPFALLGLFGALSGHRAKLDVYSSYKRLELLLVLIICLCEMARVREDTWDVVFSFLFFACWRLLWDFSGMYIAWSSVVKLRSSGTFEQDRREKASLQLTYIRSYEVNSKGEETV